MKIFVSGFVAAIAASLLVQTASAQRPDRPGPPPLIRALDANGDREISTDEIAKAAEALKGLDKNNDGKLTREELIGSGPRPGFRGGPRGPQRDSRGPHQGARGQQGPPRGHHQAHRGRCGSGRSERSRGHRGSQRGERARGPQHRGHRGGPAANRGHRDGGRRGGGHHRGEGRRGGRPGGPERAKAAFGRLMEKDKDGDGKISKEESPERMKNHFDQIDTNSDGFVDKAELKKMAEKFRGGRGGPPRGGKRPEGKAQEKKE